MTEFVVIYKVNTNLSPTLYNSKFEDHGKFIEQIHKNGMLSKAGPLNDTTGMAIFKAKDYQEVLKIVHKDPAVIEGLLSVEVNDWEVYLD